MKRTISLSLCLLLLAGLLAACGKSSASESSSGVNDTTETPTESQSESQSESSFKVTFYDGDSVLKTETVESGKTVAEFTPEKAGHDFVGWFSTPSKNHVFDFSVPIVDDTPIFAGFSFYQEDTRDFFLVGSGKSKLLVQSGWGATVTDEMKFTKTPGKNEYTLTTDLLKGDQFQIAINGSWQHQRGFGYILEYSLPDGTVVFSGDGGYLDASAKNKNIIVEVDGNYTLILETFPADDTYDEKRDGFSEETKENYNQGTYDKITWVRNGDPQNTIETETTYYIKGETITGWGDVYDNSTRMVNDGSGKHSLSVMLLESEPFLFTSMVTANGSEAIGSEYLKFGHLDEAGQALFSAQNPDNPADANLVALEEGEYLFVYDPSTATLSVTKVD